MDTRIYYFAIYATIHFTVRLPSRLTEGRIRRVLGTSRCGDRDAGIFDMRCAGVPADAAARAPRRSAEGTRKSTNVAVHFTIDDWR